MSAATATQESSGEEPEVVVGDAARDAQVSEVSCAASTKVSSEIKVILLGDSAVGKSKLVERFLTRRYSSHESSTRALSLYRYVMQHPSTKRPVQVDIYDTAGQERFASMHQGYYIGAHACLLCFDLTRRGTYRSLDNWYRELRRNRPRIPVVLLANKCDAVDPSICTRDFKFALDRNLEVVFASASRGDNVAKAFDTLLNRAVQYKERARHTRDATRDLQAESIENNDNEPDDADFFDDVMELLRDEDSAPNICNANSAPQPTSKSAGAADAPVPPQKAKALVNPIDLSVQDLASANESSSANVPQCGSVPV